MTLRTIASISATSVLLFGIGAVTATASMVVAGLTVGLVAALMISIKTDDPTRSMTELLLEQPAADVIAEERAVA